MATFIFESWGNALYIRVPSFELCLEWARGDPVPFTFTIERPRRPGEVSWEAWRLVGSMAWGSRAT